MSYQALPYTEHGTDICCGLNIWVPAHPYVEILMSSGMVLGHGPLGGD